MNPFRAKTRKYAIHEAWLAAGDPDAGEQAARALAATLPEPVKETTLRTWFSDWRHNRFVLPKPKPQLPPETKEILRAAGSRLAHATRIEGRALAYGLPNGKIARMRTNVDRVLQCKDQLFEQHSDYILIVMPKEPRSLKSGIEAYLVPTEIVRKALDDVMAKWKESHADSDNDMYVIGFDRAPQGGGTVEDLGRDFATKWAEYRLPGTEPAPALALVPPAPKPAKEPVIRCLDDRRFKIVHDQEILNAPDMDGAVTLLRNSARFSELEPTNADFMRAAAVRAGTLSGRKIRTDSAEHFIWDLAAAGLIEIIKREIVLDEAA